jgi:branched-chain amino acid transport system permease protein
MAGIFSGVAGLLFAYTYQAMVPNNFALETSALPMLMVIMGGGATLWGPALGAVVIVLVQNYAGIYMPDRWPLILGILYVLCVMFLRGGFARHLTNAWYKVGSRIFSENKVFEPADEEHSGEELKS